VGYRGQRGSFRKAEEALKARLEVAIYEQCLKNMVTGVVWDH
jgi:hypothetical protein